MNREIRSITKDNFELWKLSAGTCRIMQHFDDLLKDKQDQMLRLHGADCEKLALECARLIAQCNMIKEFTSWIPSELIEE